MHVTVDVTDKGTEMHVSLLIAQIWALKNACITSNGTDISTEMNVSVVMGMKLEL